MLPAISLDSCARNGAIESNRVRFAGVFVTFRSAFLASALALGAMRVRLCVDSAGGGALSTYVGAQFAEVAMVGRTPRQGIHRRGTDIGTIEINQCALRRAFADIRRRAGLTCVDRFFARFDTRVQVN